MHVVTDQHSRQRCNNCCTSMKHKARTTGAASLQASAGGGGGGGGGTPRPPPPPPPPPPRAPPPNTGVPNARQKADQALTRPRVFACTPLRLAVVSIKKQV